MMTSGSRPRRKLLWFLLSVVVVGSSAYANDSAVEVSAGGIRLRKERSVLMEKERLFISDNLVRVEYEFRNTTDVAVTSEVAFPIPPFEYSYLGGPKDFADFRAWVNDAPVAVSKDVRAIAGGRDVTRALRDAGITIDGFGGFDPSDGGQLRKLEPAIRDKLVRLGALQRPNPKDPNNPYDYGPNWNNKITYHWRQTFPPKTVVRVRHEYAPVLGYEPDRLESFRTAHRDACLDGATYAAVRKRVGDDYFFPHHVSYILTTANTWQTPIKDFEVVIQKSADEFVTFCWDGAVERLDDTRFRMRRRDFIPTKELRVYFLGFYSR